ncbi:MAG: hypothetical protein GY898_06990 [Proteobacteria bacterium]|nr:hypothetical protein [Pseudomonadota bacterium]
MTAKPYRKASGPLIFVLLVGSLLVALVVTKPTWESAQTRSRTAECGINLEHIADLQAAIEEETGAYLGCPQHPAALPTEASPWDTAPPCWARLGFQPDILLWGQYKVVATAKSWSATCTIDADGDGEPARWTASDAITAAPDPAFED